MKIINGRYINPAEGIDEIRDVELNGNSEMFDAKGMVVCPGLVDMHCHLREPNQSEELSETIESGTLSALTGGYTTIACMPNTNPVADSPELVKYIKNAPHTSPVNVLPIASISKNLQGSELSPLNELKKAGAIAFSDDGVMTSNPNIMREALRSGHLIISHSENKQLANGGSMNEGDVCKKLGFKGITHAAEEVAIAREIILAETETSRIHIAHVSTAASVQLIREAKARGVKVTCETCPHYFSLTDEAVETVGTNAKMNPPLRQRTDVEAIKQGLKDGTIDVIATDHAPHTSEKKSQEFSKAPFGIIGFETALPLGITHLVKTGILSLYELIEKMSTNPANILGIKPHGFIVFDPDEKYIVKEFKSKSSNSPFIGHELYGKISKTFADF